MKTKLSPLCPTFAWLRWAKLVSYVVCLFTLCPAPSALSQIPQGFNYQAIARDGDGPLEGPIDIYIAITTDDTEIPVVLWEELHDDIYPNTQGLFNIVVGGGLTQTGDFSLIDWTKTPLYIRTKINSTVMGIEPLWSVPYAMVADSLGGPLKNLKVKAPATASNTEALFEVKNKTGQTVFAVYNEGVRIYVSDGDKGPKGGFAIGGFSTGKAPSQPYLIVNPDTVRIYVNQSGKGVKGGFAIGGYGTDKADPQDFLFISDDSVRIYVDNADADTTKGVKGGFAIGGYGTAKGKPQDLLVVNNDSVRIYVDNNPTDKGPKGGFAIGGYGTDKGWPQKLLTVSNDSIRMYIDDSGKGPKGGFAIGGFDQAKGEGNNVNFFNVSTDANDTINPSEPRILWYPKKNAFLTGQVLIELIDSVGTNSTATGFESKAVGDQSQAMGYQAVARGDYSTSIGYQSLARKDNSFAFGQWAQALNQESYALGRGAISEGFRSFAFGSAGIDSAGSVTGVAYSKGDYSFAIGQGSQSFGIGSVTLGVGNTANGDYSVAIGYSSLADYYGALSVGVHNEATLLSTAIGFYAKALAPLSIAVGAHNTAEGGFANAIGLGSYANGDGSTALGYAATASGGGFASGYMTNASSGVALGFSTTASNYGMATGVSTNATGLYSFASGRESDATGDYSTAMGYNSTASGPSSFAAGYQTQAKGDFSSVALGYGVTASGSISTATGQSTHAKGNLSFTMGVSSIAAGAASLATGGSTKTRGTYTSTFGYYTYAKPYGSVALGRFNDTTCSASGMTSWISTDPVFIIGNGTADNARANAMTVLKNGNVGIGTASPTHLLDIRGQLRIKESLDYDVWLQGGSATGSGYTDDRNLAILGFDEDSGDKLFVNFLSEYGMGTVIGGPVAVTGTLLAEPVLQVFKDISGNAAAKIMNLQNATNADGLYIQAGSKTAAGSALIGFYNPNGTYIGQVYQSGAETISYLSASDARLKENIVNSRYSVIDLMNIHVRDFNFISDPSKKTMTGFLAQEVYEIYPDAVFRPETIGGIWQVDYGRITPLIVKAVQDQQEEIESLKETIKQLETLVQQLIEEK